MASAVFPVAGWRGRVTNHWGSATERGGTDIFAAIGTPVLAVIGGTVRSTDTGGLGGNTVYIESPGGLVHYYAHLARPASVSVGSAVTAGQQIGVVGNTGNASNTSPHLHFGMGYGLYPDRSGVRSGTGQNFDAVTFLQGILDGTGAGAPLPSGPGNIGGVIGDVASGALQSVGSVMMFLAGILQMITAVITGFARLVTGGKSVGN